MTATNTIERPDRSRRPQRRRGISRPASITAMLMVLLSLLIAPLPASAADPTPSPTEVAEPTKPVVQLSPGNAGTIRPGEALRVVVDVQNPTANGFHAGTATLGISRTALTSADETRAWLEGTDSLPDLTDTTSAAVGAIGAGQSASATLTIAATHAALTGLAPGSYPISVRYQDGADQLTVRSVVTVVATTSANPVTLIMPIIAPPGPRVLLSSDDLGTLTATDGALTGALDAVTSSAIVLAIDPSIIASIRALGVNAPASATTWLERLDGMPNARFALPFADADVAIQLNAGAPSLLAPTSLESELSATSFPTPPSNDATPAPTATTTPAPQLPTLEQLTDVTPTITNLVWPATDTVSEAVVDGLTGSTLLASSAQLNGGAAAHRTAGGADVIAYDADASAALTRLATSPDPAERGGIQAEVAAYLQFAAKAAPGAPVAVVIDRAAAYVPDGLRDAIATIPTAGALFATWAQASAATPTDASWTYAGAVAERSSAMHALLAGQDRIGKFATVLQDPILLTGRERARLLNTLAALNVNGAGWEAAFTAQRERDATILGSVSVTPPANVTFVSSGVNIPMWIRNDLPFPVAVTLVVKPTDLRLKVRESTEVDAVASSSTRVLVPVTAGISNGDSRLGFELRSTASPAVVVTPMKYTDVTVRADWEGIGLIILIALVVALLGFGTIRTVRRRRRGHVEDEPSRSEAHASFRTKTETDVALAKEDADG